MDLRIEMDILWSDEHPCCATNFMKRLFKTLLGPVCSSLSTWCNSMFQRFWRTYEIPAVNVLPIQMKKYWTESIKMKAFPTTCNFLGLSFSIIWKEPNGSVIIKAHNKVRFKTSKRYLWYLKTSLVQSLK